MHFNFNYLSILFLKINVYYKIYYIERKCVYSIQKILKVITFCKVSFVSNHQVINV